MDGILLGCLNSSESVQEMVLETGSGAIGCDQEERTSTLGTGVPDVAEEWEIW